MNNVAFAIPSTYRLVAAVTLMALLAWTLGLPSWVQTAHAANVSQMYDLLSTSAWGVDAQHDIFFTTSNAWTSGMDFRIYFDEATSAFDFAGMTDADIVASSTGFTAVLTGACGGPTDEIELSVNVPGEYIQGNVCAGDTVPAGRLGFQIGNTNFVANPSANDSYVISLQGDNTSGTPIPDEGDTRVAIIEDVTVTAAVDTVFTFSINGVDEGVTVNDDIVATTGTSTATTVPFGTIAPGGANAKLMAQELQVDTNAYNGFAVTVESDVTLTAGNGATIDTFIDGQDTASTTLWTSPAGTMGSPDTYGHWGLTTDDDAVSGASSTQWGIGEAAYRGDFVGNPVEVFYHNTPVENDAGVGVGSTTVAYKVEIMALQEAAKDYQATLTYIATPVF